MRSKKLVWCCIAGIALGFIAPMIFHFNQSTSLSVGLAAGLGVGYLLDILDEKKEKQADEAVLSEKAKEAKRLMAQARAELNGEPAYDIEEETADDAEDPETELSAEEQTEKLNAAEEMLRKARERMK